MGTFEGALGQAAQPAAAAQPGAQPAVQPTTSQNTSRKGIKEFRFDLRTLDVNDVLPFDESFTVRATINENITAGRLQFRTLNALETCAPTLFPGNPPPKVYEGTVVEKQDETGDELVIAPGELILPNRTYCFAFEVDRPFDSAEFQIAMRDSFDAVLRGVQQPSLAVPELRAIQARARAGLLRIAAAQGATLRLPAQKSAFAENPSDQDITGLFAKDIQPIIEAQDNRNDEFGNFCAERKIAITNLGKVRSGTAAVVLDKLYAAALTQPSVAELLNSQRPALERFRNDDVLVALRQSSECSDGTPGRSLLATWEQPAVLTRAAYFDRAAKHAAAVRDILNALVNNKELREMAGITGKQVDDALVELKPAARAFAAAAVHLTEATSALEQRDQALSAVAKSVEVVASQTVRVAATSTQEFVARHNLYVSADVGLGTAPQIDESFGYVGVNFYSRAINKDALLGWSNKDRDWWRRRLSAMVGLTLQNISRSGSFEGLIDNKAVVGAVGFRVLEGVRLSVGGLLLRESDPNPLVDDASLAITPFVSISVDWDVRASLGALAAKLGVTQ